MGKRRRKSSKKYPQDWPSYNAARCNRKRHFRQLLRELCNCVKQPEQLLGRPRLPLGDVIFCMVYKIYTKWDSRVFTGDADDACDMGFLGRVPHFNTLGNYYRKELLTPVLERLIELSSLPVVPFETKFAAAATGFSTDRYARWMDVRMSEEISRRQWVKVHLISGVGTHIVTSVIVSWGHESQFFGRLVKATKRNFRMEEVSADKAYLSGENFLHALLAGATPFIAFKSTSCLDASYKSTIWRRMLSMFLSERERFLAHYNKRNNVESTFASIKNDFGDFVRGRDERAQVNEVLAKVLCHNLCVLIRCIYELGISPKFEAIINPAAEAARKEEALEPIGEGRIVAGVKKMVSGTGLNTEFGSEGHVSVCANQLSLFADD